MGLLKINLLISSSAMITLVMFLLIMLKLHLTHAQAHSHLDYDHMEVVQTWVPTFCRIRSCTSKPPEDFTLHGLWPSDKNAQSLLACKGKYPRRNLKAVFNSLSRDLNRVWPSITKFKAEDLWVHEYMKHGICAESTLTPKDYFEAAIKARERINLLAAFKSETIEPANHKDYEKALIKKAVAEALTTSNMKVYISCRNINATHVYLYEIYTCLDPRASKDINCPSREPIRGCGDATNPMRIIVPRLP